ncbi:MAG: ParB family chromosome partitioning protein [Patiriisocius sp.]|jgi:ParB family chromosome partitioning protein
MAFQGDSIFWVEVGKVVPNPFQPRREFNEDKLKELSESVRMYGILQPLTVTRKEIQRADGAFYTEYELIAGERRLRASKLAGLEQVPVIIRSGEDTDQEKLELAIIENLQREDLNAVDRAIAFKQLAEVFTLSHAQVAKKVGRSREYVSNSIRLLGLPECMLNSLKLGDISEGHARTLLMLKERPEEQDVVYREILLKKLSVREVERIARKIATDKVRKKKWSDTDAHLIAIEKEFTTTLGTRVQISKTDFGGKLTIDYFSDEDLQKLLQLMKSEEEEKKNDETEEGEESGTVITEMSSEASIMAKISAATPLAVVPEVIEQTQEPVIEVPAGIEQLQELVDTEAVGYVAPDSPIIADEVILDVVEDVALNEDLEGGDGVIDSPAETLAAIAQQAPESPITEEREELSSALDTAMADPIASVAQSLTSEVPEVTPVVEVASSPEPEQAQAPEPMRSPVDLGSDEFSFVREHGEQAREKDLVMPYQSQQSEPVVETTAPSEMTETPVKEEEESEDEDLYSMKNFSL